MHYNPTPLKVKKILSWVCRKEYDKKKGILVQHLHEHLETPSSEHIATYTEAHRCVSLVTVGFTVWTKSITTVQARNWLERHNTCPGVINVYI